MCPSGRPPILFLVFLLVLYYEISHLEPLLGSVHLPFLQYDLLTLVLHTIFRSLYKL